MMQPSQDRSDEIRAYVSMAVADANYAAFAKLYEAIRGKPPRPGAPVAVSTGEALAEMSFIRDRLPR